MVRTKAQRCWNAGSSCVQGIGSSSLFLSVCLPPHYDCPKYTDFVFLDSTPLALVQTLKWSVFIPSNSVNLSRATRLKATQRRGFSAQFTGGRLNHHGAPNHHVQKLGSSTGADFHVSTPTLTGIGPNAGRPAGDSEQVFPAPAESHTRSV